MSEYIKKNAVLSKEFEAEINTYDGEYNSVAYVVLASDVYKIPAEDVIPVIHAHWIEDEYTGRLCCSECGGVRPYDMSADEIDYWSCNFCRTCGAKMEAE